MRGVSVGEMVLLALIALVVLAPERRVLTRILRAITPFRLPKTKRVASRMTMPTTPLRRVRGALVVGAAIAVIVALRLFVFH